MKKDIKQTALTHLVEIYVELKNVSIGQRSNSPMGKVQDKLADFLDTYPDELRYITRKEYKDKT
jgi:hypothetical protein